MSNFKLPNQLLRSNTSITRLWHQLCPPNFGWICWISMLVICNMCKFLIFFQVTLLLAAFVLSVFTGMLVSHLKVCVSISVIYGGKRGCLPLFYNFLKMKKSKRRFWRSCQNQLTLLMLKLLWQSTTFSTGFWRRDLSSPQRRHLHLEEEDKV